MLLGANSVQYVARLRDMRKIDLGLNSIRFSATGTRRLTCTLRLADRAEVFPHLYRFMVFNGTGMSLLLGDSDFLKHIENSFTFNFQLPCQIVDSNLAHPLFLSSTLSR